jgi:hypothetical protein
MNETFKLYYDGEDALADILRHIKKHMDRINEKLAKNEDYTILDLRNTRKPITLDLFPEDIRQSLKDTSFERNLQHKAPKFGIDDLTTQLDTKQQRILLETIIENSKHLSVRIGEDTIHYRSLDA